MAMTTYTVGISADTTQAKKELLEVKYGNGADLTTNSLYSTKCWCDNTCCVVLSLTYGQSNGGDYYWYCTLDYYDDKAFTSETKSNLEEL